MATAAVQQLRVQIERTVYLCVNCGYIGPWVWPHEGAPTYRLGKVCSACGRDGDRELVSVELFMSLVEVLTDTERAAFFECHCLECALAQWSWVLGRSNNDQYFSSWRLVCPLTWRILSFCDLVVR